MRQRGGGGRAFNNGWAIDLHPIKKTRGETSGNLWDSQTIHRWNERTRDAEGGPWDP
jgi:hypothetical protein